MPTMNVRPAASIAFWFASDITPTSATTVTSGSRWAAMNSSITGLGVASTVPPEDALDLDGRRACNGRIHAR
jgi:hypothetical protein